MADVFKRFISNLTSTNLTTVFTVPEANVASTPPVPVSTFVVKSLSVHNYVKVFEGGDLLKVQANASNRAMVTVSLLEIKQQQ